MSKKLPQKIKSSIEKYMVETYGEDYCLFSNDFSQFLFVDEKCVILVADSILVVDPATYLLNQIVSLEEHLGQFFEIHQHGTDYILYGELEIVCLSSSFEQLWVFTGRDILVRQDSSPAFIIAKSGITSYDWLGWRYELDFEGNLLSETLE